MNAVSAYAKLVRPLLFSMEAETAHDLAWAFFVGHRAAIWPFALSAVFNHHRNRESFSA